MRKLHIDIETFSSVNIKTHGLYNYVASPDFEILMVCYAFAKEPVTIIDLYNGEKLPEEFINAMLNKSVKKCAHNAAFERACFNKFGLKVPADQWHCSMIKAAYCGLPLSLQDVGQALNFDADKAKLTKGKALIKYFCVPCKPTKVNGGRTRNLPLHDIEKWQDFLDYCAQDVKAEREVDRNLRLYRIPQQERELYKLDQIINDRGVLIDTDFAKNAIGFDEFFSGELREKMQELTGLDNPNSPTQLAKWLSDAMKIEVKSVAKDVISSLLEKANSRAVIEVLNLRRMSSKTSIKKYVKMLTCAGFDDRARGLLQFYGANRTGRWAGRLIQIHNLPRNYIKLLAYARSMVAGKDYDLAELFYSNISKLLSELIRTAIIAPKNKIFAVADFSAIEARVTAWYAKEKWRIDIFNTHGKLYEASAAMMFNVPLDSIKPGSDLRSKGKVSELALGFGGSVGALKKMGGESMGLSETEMKSIVTKWRDASPNVVKFWKDCESCAKRAVQNKGTKILDKHKRLTFLYDGRYLTIQLPQGRKLFYSTPQIYIKSSTMPNGRVWTRHAIRYKGFIQTIRKWGWIDTYGGKLAENIIQATARDMLADSMMRLHKKRFKIVMHVHDEVIIEIKDDQEKEQQLQIICDIMGQPVSWADGLPSNADGYLTPFYKKD